MITITPTKLRDYLKCPLQYRFIHVERRKSDSPQMAFGRAIHRTLEEFYKPFIMKDAGDTLRRFWNSKSYGGREESDKYFAKGKLILENYTDKFLKPILPVECTIGTEHPLKFDIIKPHLKIRLITRIDRISATGDLLELTDYKTDSHGRVPTEESLKTHLPTYLCYLLAQKNFKQHRRIRVTYLNVRSLVRSSVEYTTEEAACNRLALWEVIREMWRAEYAAKPSESCRWCPFKDDCPAASRVENLENAF
jgi:CRISPR/Cas system-associated exonuclease Cas4 (RecB family)